MAVSFRQIVVKAHSEIVGEAQPVTCIPVEAGEEVGGLGALGRPSVSTSPNPPSASSAPRRPARSQPPQPGDRNGYVRV